MIIACMAGYSWIYLNLSHTFIGNKPVEVCLIKHFTSIPCPSCGATRAVVALVKGNYIEAIEINPLGYIISIIMLLTPLWIVVDISLKRKTLFEFYQKMEAFLKKPMHAIPLLLLVFINWIWNITKGL